VRVLENAPRTVRSVLRGLWLNALGIVVVALLVFPAYWALCVALENDPNFYASSPALLPVHLIWANVRIALSEEGGSVVTSLAISLAVVVIG
jgi:ABC-type glycerol-3-phosphate transport system permease component